MVRTSQGPVGADARCDPRELADRAAGVRVASPGQSPGLWLALSAPAQDPPEVHHACGFYRLRLVGVGRGAEATLPDLVCVGDRGRGRRVLR